MAAPPSNAGADQVRSTRVDSSALPTKSVGAPGSEAAASLSVTVAVALLPALTPVGSGVPKPSCTLSPSSSSKSLVAVTMIVFEISDAPNVSVTGTPE